MSLTAKLEFYEYESDTEKTCSPLISQNAVSILYAALKQLQFVTSAVSASQICLSCASAQCSIAFTEKSGAAVPNCKTMSGRVSNAVAGTEALSYFI